MRANDGAEASFIYTLAHDLGKTVTELRETMPAEELAGWNAWYNLRAERIKRR